MSEWYTFDDRETLDQALAEHVTSKLAQGISARGVAHLIVPAAALPQRCFHFWQTQIWRGSMSW